MTNSEALAAVIQIENVPAGALEKALVDQSLTGSDTYSAGLKSSINLAALDVLNGILVSSISEGGYSISFDLSAVKARITALGGGPRVRGVSVW